MSDVYSDLNVKNGSKIVLGESGVAISSSGCVVLESGCTYDLSNVATRCYVDDEISKICTGGSVSGDYLPATNVALGDNCSFYNVDKIVQFSEACVHLINPDVNKGIIVFDSVENRDQDASFVKGGWTDSNSKCSSFLDLGACCVMFYSGGACFQFPVKNDKTTPYTLATTEDIASGGTSGNYVKTDCTGDQSLEGGLCVPCLAVNSPIVFNGPCVFNVLGRIFSVPQKECGEYTLVTTDDISGAGSGSGCTYPTCYPLYSWYSQSGTTCFYYVGGLCYENYCLSLKSCSVLSIIAECSIYFNSAYQGDSFCVYVPRRLPYTGNTGFDVNATIVTSPGYSESGCGLQICVLTQSEYNNMQDHGMTTLYFIKPEI